MEVIVENDTTRNETWVKVPACPKCGYTGKWKHYHGMLGYESLVCPKCALDVADIKIGVNF